MHFEFIKLIDTMETKGLKMFKNIKTHHISLLDPLQKVKIEYKPLLAKRSLQSSNNQTTKVPCFNLT